MATSPEEKSLAVVPAAPPAGAPPAPPPNYMTGFDGMAAAPFSDKVLTVLNRPINPDDVEIKPDGIVFLPGAWWRGRLFEAFGPGGWALAPRQPARVMGDLVIYPGALYCLGRFVGEATGECAYRANNPNMSYASCLEGAKTDALSRCAKDIIPAALVLWDQQWREAWCAKYATKTWDKDAKNGKGAYRWSRRNQRELVDAIDLMAGAGGSVPTADTKPESAAAEAPAGTTTPTTAPAEANGTVGQVSQEAQEPTDTSDEVALAEARAELVVQFRRLELRKGTVRTWVKQTFGVADFDKLNLEQTDNAVALMKALEPGDLGGPRELPTVYTAMMDNLKSNGKVL